MPVKQPENNIWTVYNHLPGGQIVAIHFQDVVRTKKLGDSTQEIRISSKESMEAFKRGPQVALYIVDKGGNGKLVKNEMLIYKGETLDWKDPKAASKVIEWARTQGVAPIPSASSSKEAKTYEYTERMERMEKRQNGFEDKLDRVLSLLEKK